MRITIAQLEAIFQPKSAFCDEQGKKKSKMTVFSARRVRFVSGTMKMPTNPKKKAQKIPVKTPELIRFAIYPLQTLSCTG